MFRVHGLTVRNPGLKFSGSGLVGCHEFRGWGCSFGLGITARLKGKFLGAGVQG